MFGDSRLSFSKVLTLSLACDSYLRSTGILRQPLVKWEDRKKAKIQRSSPQEKNESVLGHPRKFFHKEHSMKFRFRERLKYMVLGSLLTLAGFMFGNMNSDTEAQLGSETINELTVRELTVLKDITIRNNSGDSLVIIYGNEAGGHVTAYGPGGGASLSVNEEGGIIIARGPDRKKTASLSVNEEGGIITARGPEGKASVTLAISKEGGEVSVSNRQGDPRAGFGIIDDKGIAFLVNRFGVPRALEP